MHALIRGKSNLSRTLRYIPGTLVAAFVVLRLVDGIGYTFNYNYTALEDTESDEPTIAFQNTAEVVFDIVGLIWLRNHGAPFSLIIDQTLRAESDTSALRVSNLRITSGSDTLAEFETLELPVREAEQYRVGELEVVKSVIYLSRPLELTAEQIRVTAKIEYIADSHSVTYALSRDFVLTDKSTVDSMWTNYGYD